MLMMLMLMMMMMMSLRWAAGGMVASSSCLFLTAISLGLLASAKFEMMKNINIYIHVYMIYSNQLWVKVQYMVPFLHISKQLGVISKGKLIAAMLGLPAAWMAA